MYSLDFRFHWEVLFVGMVTVCPTFMKFSVRVNIYCIARDTFWPWPCSDLVLTCTVSKIIPGGQIEDHIWTCSPVHTLAVSSPWFISRMPQVCTHMPMTHTWECTDAHAVTHIPVAGEHTRPTAMATVKLTQLPWWWRQGRSGWLLILTHPLFTTTLGEGWRVGLWDWNETPEKLQHKSWLLSVKAWCHLSAKQVSLAYISFEKQFFRGLRD